VRVLVHLLLLAAANAGEAPAEAPAAQVAPRIVELCADVRGEEEILVCGHPQADAPYRLPPQPDLGFDPRGDVASVSRERNALLGPGPAGLGSCSTVGSGGWTGCDVIAIEKAEEQGKRIGVGTGGVRIGLQVGRKLASSVIR
jgi:hypothetical protein